MAVCIESDEGLQQRRGHLENQRDDSDLGEREAEFLLQERVDGRDHRLHHVVQQVGDADHEQYRVDCSGLREAPQACVRGFCKRLHCCGLWFFSIRVIASRAFRTSPARMYPSNCPCVGWVASRHSVSLYILLNLFFQMGGRRAVQLAQDFVVRGLGQGDVEVDVGFDTGLQCPGSCGRSRSARCFRGLRRRVPFAVRRLFGDRDFQYFPHFVQVVQVGAPEAPLHRFVRGA